MARLPRVPFVTLTPRQFNSEQHTPILYEGHLYAVRKHGGGSLVCLDLDGNERWNSGADKFGHGPYLIADGLILVLDNDGRLTAVEASPDSYRRWPARKSSRTGATRGAPWPSSPGGWCSAI